MSDDREGLTGREVGAILARLDSIQETMKAMNKMVGQHETTINRLRGAMWLMGAGMPFLLLLITWVLKRL